MDIVQAELLVAGTSACCEIGPLGSEHEALSSVSAYRMCVAEDGHAWEGRGYRRLSDGSYREVAVEERCRVVEGETISEWYVRVLDPSFRFQGSELAELCDR